MPAEAAERHRTLRAYQRLRDAGCNEAVALLHVGKELGISLLVLPPRRPQFNGCVERANRSNRSARTEFWSLYDGPLNVTSVTPRLTDYEFFYNCAEPVHRDVNPTDSF